MKRSPFLVLLVVCISFFEGFSQVGIGTSSPNQKAVLELKSPGNNQGFLVPRLTTIQRTGMTGLASPEKGLLVFDTDLNKFHYWSGSAWVVIEDNTGTDSQTLTFNPATGLLAISGGNNVTVTGTTPGGAAGGDLTGAYPNPSVAANAVTASKLQSDAAVDANRAVTTNHIRDNAITSAKISDGTIVAGDLADGSVTSAKVLDGTISNNDINAAAAIAVTKVAAGTNGQILTTVAGVPTWNTPSSGGSVTNVATGTGLTGGPITTTGTISIAANGVTATELRSDAATDANRSVTTNHLRDNSVTSAKIADGIILNIDLADAIISTNKIVDGAITTLKILDGTIGTTDLIDNAITAVKLATDAVTSSKILDGTLATADLADNAITTVKIATDAVTSAKIVDGTLATADLSDNAITTVKIAADAVTSAKIVDGTLATADLADNAVTTVKVAGDAITSAKILDGTLATADLADNAVSTVKIATDAVTSAKILDGTIVTADILDGTVGTLDIANSAITNGKVADNAINSIKIADGTVATVDLLDGAITNAKIATGIDVTKLSSGTNGFVLTSVLGNVTWTALPVLGLGTVTSVGTGAGLTGGPITTTGTISLADGGVTTIKVADDAISSAKLQDDAVTDANRAVTTNHIRDNAITSAKIVDGTIVSADILDGTVSSADITNGTIATVDVADGAITDLKIAPGITASKVSPSGNNNQVLTTVAGATVWADLPASGTGTVTSVATGAGLIGGPITTTGTISLADNGVTTIKVLDGAITTSKVLDGTLLTADLADGSVNSLKMLDGSIVNADINGLAGIAVTKLAPSTSNGDVLTTVGGAPQWQAPVDNSVTNEIQNISQVLSTGTNAGNQAITNLASLSIGTTAPGSLSVTGSHYVSYNLLGTVANYSVVASDYIIVGTASPSVQTTVTLPDAAANLGRVLIFKGRSVGSATVAGLRVAGLGGDTIDGATITPFLTPMTDTVVSITIVAISATEWITINRSVF